MNKAELESKHLAELHSLAAEAGIERYRMLPRAELVEKLAGDGGSGRSRPAREGGQSSRGARTARGGQERGGRGSRERGGRGEERPRQQRERKPRKPREEREKRAPAEEPAPSAGERKAEPQVASATTPPPKPKRKRRRRRWGRRRKGLGVQDLLLPATPGRRTIVYAESREACTALLREVAAELSGASDGPDPIALLVDPSPEELADWKREAPQAELVSAGKAGHADDALAQAALRANGGEDVIVLIDSLSRFAETFADAEAARYLFDAGPDATGGSLTVVAAVTRGA